MATPVKTSRDTAGRIVGSPSATPPMLLNLKRWNVDQCLWLPGQAGNYTITSAANLLDADTAHIEQSIGGWVNDSGGGSLQRSAVAPVFGNGHLHWMDVGGGTCQIVSHPIGEGIPVTAGSQYSVNVQVRAVTSSRWMYARAHWLDSGGATLGVVTFGNSIFVGDSWTTLSGTLTAPSGATTCRILVRADNNVDGDEFYLDAVTFREGSDPTFVPSTRIVGDIDVRTKLVPYAHDDSEGLISTAYGTGWWFVLSTNRRLHLGFTPEDNSNNQFKYSSVDFVPVKDGNPICLGFQRNATTGDITFRHGPSFSDMPNEEVVASPAMGILEDSVRWIGDISNNTFPTKGAYLAFEVRDGIDGPIVASTDFTDPAEVTGDNWTTPEGHAASINRLGDATTELVDRNCWAFTGNEYFNLPYEDKYNISDSDFEAHGHFRSRQDAGNPLFAKRATIGVEMRAHGVGRWAVLFDDGPTVVTATSVYNASAWTLGGMAKEGVSAYAFINGITGPPKDISALGSVENQRDIFIGSRSEAGSLMGGLAQTILYFSRVLTDQERTQLAAWDGSVADEPSWLRTDPDLVLYLNADDPLTAPAYANDNVIDLRGMAHPSEYVKVHLPA